jgi:integral membrane protein (TIGR01906 family)
VSTHREEQLHLSKALVTLLRWLIVLAMPIVIVLLSARIMVNRWYPIYEYAKPDFPPDAYGFTQAQRLDLALVNIDYLNRPEPPDTAIKMLMELRLPGSDRLLFTVYEIRHMLDVKRLMDTLWRVLWGVGGLMIVSLAALLARPETRREGYAAIFGGGLLTSVLLVVIIAFVLLSWNSFFVTFHDVFFPPGTWTFDWSDSLIRLFPDKFWFDAGVLLVGGALAAGIIVTLVGYFLGRRHA